MYRLTLHSHRQLLIAPATVVAERRKRKRKRRKARKRRNKQWDSPVLN
jgi:hypothetical protein